MVDNMSYNIPGKIRIGNATLSGGTVTVSDNFVRSTSLILITAGPSGGADGVLRVSAISDGEFTILSSVGSDDADVSYLIFNREDI